MNRPARWNMTAVVVMAVALFHVAMGADAPQYPWLRPDGSVDYQKLPRRPQPGDELGYPKAQSAQILPPDVREFLDGVLQLYSVNGLFLDAARTYDLLGTQPTRLEMLRQDGHIVGYTTKFAPTGVFARPQWHGSRIYASPYPGGRSGRIDVLIEVDPSVDCVDSRAVEGYLDLSLDPVLNTVPPVPPERWDRHGVFGEAYARSISPDTPGVALSFSGGCLSRIDVRMPIRGQEEVSLPLASIEPSPGGRADMRRVPFFVLLALALFGAGAPVAADEPPRQASEWYQTPADARYDAASPVLPSDYPARRYSEADLIRSLVALAERDSLSSGDVEHEFGMRFVDGFARGQPPLGTRLSSASGSPVLRSLNLSFVSRQTRSEFIAGAPHRRVTCVNAATLARAFRASGWRLAVVHRYGHSGGDEHTFAKTVAGTERRIVIRPFPHDDDTSRSGACVDFVHYLFDVR